MIAILAVEEASLRKPWIAGTNLNVETPIDWHVFQKMEDPTSINTLFFDLIQNGFDRLRNGWGLPVDILKEILDGFRDGGFANEWNFKRRKFREFDLAASLDCKIDLEKFTLTLTITKGKAVLFQDEILVADPDPIFWYDDFKDVIVADGFIEVPKRIGAWSEETHTAYEALFSWKIPNFH